MFSLGRAKRSLLGIDIGSTAIKLVELARAPRAGADIYSLQAFAHETLPVGAVKERKIEDIDAVGKAIARALGRSRSKTKRAAVAVSGSATITKTLNMSADLSEAELEAQIQLEADQYIPYPLEEVNMDFDILGPSPAGKDLIEVLLAASRRENVDDRVAALEIAGLKAEIVDIETYAMEHACSLQLARDGVLQQQTVAVAEVGATTTTLHVLHNGKIVYTREQNFGGNQLVEEIHRRYDVERDQILLALDAGGLPENAATEVVGPFKEALAQQVGRALQFFYSASTLGRTDRLILAGGAASLPKIAELVEQRLGFPVQVANPFLDMPMASAVDQKALLRSAPSMMIAVGLSLRGYR